MNPHDQDIIAQALNILRQQVHTGCIFDSPEVVKQYLRVKCACLNVEQFGVVWLDQTNRVLESVVLFSGSVAQTSVYPREVIRDCLRVNASACVVWHNHPSGNAEPSRADEHLTKALKDALAVVDCRVLDHLVIGNPGVVSFAERGMI